MGGAPKADAGRTAAAAGTAARTQEPLRTGATTTADRV